MRSPEGAATALGELAGCLSLAHARLPQINHAAALPIIIEVFIAVFLSGFGKRAFRCKPEANESAQ
jgi:branched-subunit amino acid ABC-type transport system permease component